MRRPQNLLASLLLFLALFGGADAGAAGRVASLTGSLAGMAADGKKRALAVESVVDAGDTLFTYEGSQAVIRFDDGGVVTLRADSQFQVREFDFQDTDPARDNVVFGLIKGGLRTLTGLIGKRNGGQYRMQTPTATIGIRGTEYDLFYCASGDCVDGLHIEVIDGAIAVTNEVGTLDIRAGQFGYVKDRRTAPAPMATGYRPPDASPAVGECSVR